MPTTPDGVDAFLEAKILYGPGKAANAGGVACSGLEMTQNAGVMHWPREEVDSRLHEIMKSIHQNCVQYGKDGGFVNYVRGANVAGFVKVADAMVAQGLV
jgi:glutamate dehydrogenase (NADP+)